MLVDQNISLQAFNSFNIAACAKALARIKSQDDVARLIDDRQWANTPKLVLGAGSNVLLGRYIEALVLKVEILGRCQVDESATEIIVQAGGGENWHDFVAWTLQQGWGGLENLALIPGTVGAAPVQNIGAYGVELKDRFHSLDAIDLTSGKLFSLNAKQCAFGYRDSIFKQHNASQPGQVSSIPSSRALILRVRLALPKCWQPVLGYADIKKKMAQQHSRHPSAQQLFDWVCQIRRAKLPDPARIGSAGSFFKNPTVSAEQCASLIKHHPKLVFYPLPNGCCKLAAGWLVQACGWRGKSLGLAGVYDKQALVLINRGAINSADSASGADIMALARAIQSSVQEKFGVWLEPEPVLLL